jgi:hypothetical protein
MSVVASFSSTWRLEPSGKLPPFIIEEQCHSLEPLVFVQEESAAKNETFFWLRVDFASITNCSLASLTTNARFVEVYKSGKGADEIEYISTLKGYGTADAANTSMDTITYSYDELPAIDNTSKLHLKFVSLKAKPFDFKLNAFGLLVNSSNSSNNGSNNANAASSQMPQMPPSYSMPGGIPGGMPGMGFPMMPPQGFPAGIHPGLAGGPGGPGMPGGPGGPGNYFASWLK